MKTTRAAKRAPRRPCARRFAHHRPEVEAHRLHGEAFPFLDGTAHFSLWPARLAATAGVQILPAFIVRTGTERYRLHIEDPIDCHESDGPREIMEKLVKVFEIYVRRYSDQWLMVRPFWDDETTVNAPGARSDRNRESQSASQSSHA